MAKDVRRDSPPNMSTIGDSFEDPLDGSRRHANTFVKAQIKESEALVSNAGGITVRIKFAEFRMGNLFIYGSYEPNSDSVR